MLDKNALTQLKQLKREIHDSTERVDGTVRGTRGRFGFVKGDDQKDVFLPPEQMQKVLPGDRVRVVVSTDKDGKRSGEVEKLLESPIKHFTGRYVVRGQGHFVEPDLPQFTRLLFLPPKERKKAQPGDLIRCEISRHPIRDGRAQARIADTLGPETKPGIEADYIVAKYQLAVDWPEDIGNGIVADRYSELRRDMREVPFVTIDAAETRDVDDALYIEENDAGWRLFVAIADPDAHMETGSELDKAALKRATTTYLPGKVSPMLPEALSNERCSLLAEADRPALVCEIQVDKTGLITEYRFELGLVRSHAKLRYRDVFAHLEGRTHLPHPELKPLGDCAEALLKRRREHHVVMQDQPDFKYILDDNGKIENIFKIERNRAHQLVEECMIAANRCAADWLREDQALFVAHQGLREDRHDNVKALLKHCLPDWEAPDVSTLEGYIALMQQAKSYAGETPLSSILSRMHQRGELNTKASPHHGMGFSVYTTFTSPLRKYTDLLVHRSLRAKLMGEALPEWPQTLLDQLQEQSLVSRQASREMERWLQCQYLAKEIEGKQDSPFNGQILHVNGGGFTVRLEDTGIEGFVDVRSLGGKHRFDANLLSLSNDNHQYCLDQAVRVKVESIDAWSRDIRFQLVNDTPNEKATEAA